MAAGPDTSSPAGLGASNAEAHLDRARKARDVLRGCWTDLTEAGVFGCELVAESGTVGRLEVTVSWPTDIAERAETAAAEFADSIKAALDAAFATATRQGKEAKQGAMGIPLCGSRNEFDAIRASGPIRRLRPDQVQIIEAVQPFYEAPDVEFDDIRPAMAQLAAMLGPRDSGAPRVAVWACNIRTEYLTREPSSTVDSAPIGAGVVVDRLVVDHIVCRGIHPDALRPNPTIGYVPIFNDEPHPADRDDSLIARADLLICVAEAFDEALRLSADLGELRERAGGPIAGRLEDPPTTRWVEVDLASADGAEIVSALTRSDLGIGTLTEASGAVSILVAADGKVFARPLPPALPLAHELTTGIAAEQATLAAAASWGLPDFVFDPRVTEKGNASREIGDGTIVVDQRAVAIQVKARENPSDTPERAAQWAAKKVREGAKQAAGTIRMLTSKPAELIDGRGRTAEVDGAAVDWVRVVILDHPDNPTPTIDAAPDGQVPIVPILRRDWDFLFDHLRSISAVVDYLFRAAAEPSHHLGHEPARYFELAQEDAASAARGPDPWTIDLGQPLSHPALPTAPPSHVDAQGHSMYRLVLEEVALAALSLPDDQRRWMLAQFDRYPVADRAELGRLLLDHLDDVTTAPDAVAWRFRRLVLDEGRLHLVFATCSTFSDVCQEAFRQYAMLRHFDVWSQATLPDGDEVLTIAVLLTPRYDGRRLWDTTLIGLQGDPGLLPADIESMRTLWPGGNLLAKD